ncbi:MAG TPA: type II secretory pathway, component PulD, partial [Opitutaceae bacterium]|nr:type II secretory pathway, component PulD [Opitutaceae bacterium]
MKNRPLPRVLLVLLALTACAVVVPAARLRAQNPTDAKIKLMSDALRARDAGDLVGAQQALAELAKLAPNDASVARLRSEIEAQAAAQQAALAQQAAAQR